VGRDQHPLTGEGVVAAVRVVAGGEEGHGLVYDTDVAWSATWCRNPYVHAKPVMIVVLIPLLGTE
jgi:hypothetical protein